MTSCLESGFFMMKSSEHARLFFITTSEEKGEWWCWREILCATSIMTYNTNMHGVDLSHQLIQYFFTHRITARCYWTMLLHFLDIATINAFILHGEICSEKHVQPMVHKDFIVELVCQLCGRDKTGGSQSRRAEDIPVKLSQTQLLSKKVNRNILNDLRDILLWHLIVLLFVVEKQTNTRGITCIFV